MSTSGGNPGDDSGEHELLCSAKGCREHAEIDLRWRNPRLHDAARVKHWLTCPAHEQYLAEFLSRRGFLLGREPIG
jgi:hypothetical protein